MTRTDLQSLDGSRDAVVRRARSATYGVFIVSGFAYASWAARLPQLRDRLALTPGTLGLVLLAVAAGSVISLPLAGAVVHRLGDRGTVVLMSELFAVGLALLAVGVLLGVAAVVLAFLLLGFGNGAWDVAMNVQAADVERHVGRAVMSRFHAGWSVGSVGGALVGAAMIALDVPITAHLLAVAALVAVLVPLAARGYLPAGHLPRGTGANGHPGTPEAVGDGRAARRPRALARWTEPRTLVIGVFVLAFAFAEGTANDWTSIAMIDGHHVAAAVGTLAFAAFLTAMTAARWFGPLLLDRYGRVPVVRGLAALAVVGVVVFVVSPVAWLAFAGAALWGLGASLGFPVGMSAAADDPAASAARVSVVASIGYCAFLGGPPLIGLLGNRFTVLHALLVVGLLMAAAAAVAGAVGPLDSARSADHRAAEHDPAR